jgi:hypothetical protein
LDVIMEQGANKSETKDGEAAALEVEGQEMLQPVEDAVVTEVSSDTQSIHGISETVSKYGEQSDDAQEHTENPQDKGRPQRRTQIPIKEEGAEEFESIDENEQLEAADENPYQIKDASAEEPESTDENVIKEEPQDVEGTVVDVDASSDT